MSLALICYFCQLFCSVTNPSRAQGLSNGTLFSRPCVPCVNLSMFSRYFSLGGAGTLLRDIFMCPAQRDTLTGHFLRPCVPCVILLIVLQCRPLFLKGRKDVWTLLRDIFYESRLTGHSSGTLFRVPMSLASFCYLFCNVGNFSLRDARTKGLYCGTFFMSPA